MKATRNRAISWSMRCYRVLLRAYPRTFLIEFEDLLCQAFGDLAFRELKRGGILGLVGLWVRTLADILSSALVLGMRDNSNWPFRLRWIEACTLGIPLGAGLVLVAYLPVTHFLWPIARALKSLNLSNSAFNIGALASIVSIPVAWLQSRVYGWNRFSRIAWIFATALGVCSGWGLMYAFFTGKLVVLPIGPHGLLVTLGGFALCGSAIGLFQTAVLANKTSRAWAWLPACAVGMIAVGFATETIEGLFRGVHPSAQILALLAMTAATVGGAIFGLLTAKPLAWILEARDFTKDDVSPNKNSS